MHILWAWVYIHVYGNLLLLLFQYFIPIVKILIGCQRGETDEDRVGIGAAAVEIFLNEMSTRSVWLNNRADRV